MSSPKSRHLAFFGSPPAEGFADWEAAFNFHIRELCTWIGEESDADTQETMRFRLCVLMTRLLLESPEGERQLANWMQVSRPPASAAAVMIGLVSGTNDDFEELDQQPPVSSAGFPLDKIDGAGEEQTLLDEDDNTAAPGGPTEPALENHENKGEEVAPNDPVTNVVPVNEDVDMDDGEAAAPTRDNQDSSAKSSNAKKPARRASKSAPTVDDDDDEASEVSDNEPNTAPRRKRVSEEDRLFKGSHGKSTAGIRATSRADQLPVDPANTTSTSAEQRPSSEVIVGLNKDETARFSTSELPAGTRSTEVVPPAKSWASSRNPKKNTDIIAHDLKEDARASANTKQANHENNDPHQPASMVTTEGVKQTLDMPQPPQTSDVPVVETPAQQSKPLADSSLDKTIELGRLSTKDPEDGETNQNSLLYALERFVGSKSGDEYIAIRKDFARTFYVSKLEAANPASFQASIQAATVSSSPLWLDAGLYQTQQLMATIDVINLGHHDYVIQMVNLGYILVNIFQEPDKAKIRAMQEDFKAALAVTAPDMPVSSTDSRKSLAKKICQVRTGRTANEVTGIWLQAQIMFAIFMQFGWGGVLHVPPGYQQRMTKAHLQLKPAKDVIVHMHTLFPQWLEVSREIDEYLRDGGWCPFLGEDVHPDDLEVAEARRQALMVTLQNHPCTAVRNEFLAQTSLPDLLYHDTSATNSHLVSYATLFEERISSPLEWNDETKEAFLVNVQKKIEKHMEQAPILQAAREARGNKKRKIANDAPDPTPTKKGGPLKRRN